MLLAFSKGKHWSSGKKKPGNLATDYVERVHLCLGLMQHPPVASQVENEWKIIPMHPITANQVWSNVIGFDPLDSFGQVSVEDSYLMRVWARDNSPLPKIE